MELIVNNLQGKKNNKQIGSYNDGIYVTGKTYDDYMMKYNEIKCLSK